MSVSSAGEWILHLTPGQAPTLSVHQGDLRNRLMTANEIRYLLEQLGLFWMHEPHSTRPHALLTSGTHSNGYVDLRPVMRRGNLCHLFACQLALKLEREFGPAGLKFDLVTGSDETAVPLAHSLAIIYSRNFAVPRKFEEVRQGWKFKGQRWDPRYTIGADEVVLHVEELMTTAETALAVRDAIRTKHPDYPVQFAPVLPVIIHRSKVERVEESRVVWLAHFDIETWEEKDCALCAAGSKAVRPNTPENWATLTGR